MTTDREAEWWVYNAKGEERLRRKRANWLWKHNRDAPLRAGKIEGTKRCSRCEQWLAIDLFRRSGMPRSYCHSCWVTYWAQWRKDNPKKIRASWRKARHTRRALEKNGPKFSESAWLLVLRRARYHCQHCGTKKRLEADHIIPLSLGGTNHGWNLQPLCKPCNSSKNNVLTGAVQPAIDFQPSP